MNWISLLAGFLALPVLAVDLHVDLDSKPVEEDSVYWSPGFMLCWQELAGLNGSLSLSRPEKHPVMDRVMNAKYDRACLPEGSLTTFAGLASPELENEINKVIARDFANDFEPISIQNRSGLYSLVLINHTIDFQKPFFPSKSKRLDFTTAEGKERKVPFFGVRSTPSADFDHIIVLDHDAEAGRRVLEVPAGLDEKLCLILDESLVTFRDAINLTIRLREQLPQRKGIDIDQPLCPRVHALDDIRVPYVSFDKETAILPLVDRPSFVDKGGLPWHFADAREEVEFSVDEQGAKVKVKTSVSLEPFGGPPEPEAKPLERHFFFDRPFFLALWKDEAPLPYFMVHVRNTDVLRAK